MSRITELSLLGVEVERKDEVFGTPEHENFDELTGKFKEMSTTDSQTMPAHKVECLGKDKALTSACDRVSKILESMELEPRGLSQFHKLDINAMLLSSPSSIVTSTSPAPAAKEMRLFHSARSKGGKMLKGRRHVCPRQCCLPRKQGYLPAQHRTRRYGVSQRGNRGTSNNELLEMMGKLSTSQIEKVESPCEMKAEKPRLKAVPLPFTIQNISICPGCLTMRPPGVQDANVCTIMKTLECDDCKLHKQNISKHTASGTFAQVEVDE